ncbi:MAG: response regulator transcription factor [Oscillospiraceae bacterium]|nr:response regulator transcription factor [Oscillospiraceae bacterium]MBR3535230.1 response regulator transcription factor [Oscillospiraceae bacterium]MBR6835570.1 response regulator transcription factor [Oscillospiraceae bacterium]MBR6925324.1 response regulator transcription factor [Oscillospiraceae bacterium]
MKILIVEDEEKLARFTELELKHEGYETEKAFDGRTGLEMAESGGFDLILLDIMLPGLNGIEVLRRIRKTSDVPVILLTARDSVMDKVSGLDTGADDYITKPFDIEELLARIRAALRKRSAKPESASAALSFGALELDPAAHTVTYDGNDIELTNKEFGLLKKLLENKSIVLSRETLLEDVWGFDYMGETNIVDVYIRYIRSKIDDVYGIKMIQTVRGVGYVIRE